MPSDTPRAQEAVALTQQLPAHIIQIDSHDLAGVGGCKGKFAAYTGLVFVDGGEERLACEQPLACADQLAEQPPAPAASAVAEDGFQGDTIFHVHEAAGLTYHGFSRVELDLHELHLVSFDPIVDDIHRHGVLRSQSGVDQAGPIVVKPI
jgi:hypothetical protein